MVLWSVYMKNKVNNDSNFVIAIITTAKNIQI